MEQHNRSKIPAIGLPFEHRAPSAVTETLFFRLPTDGAGTSCSWRDCSAENSSSGDGSLSLVLEGTICLDKRLARCSSMDFASVSLTIDEAMVSLTLSGCDRSVGTHFE